MSSGGNDPFDRLMKQSSSGVSDEDVDDGINMMGNMSASRLLSGDPFDASEGSMGDLDMDDLESDDILRSSPSAARRGSLGGSGGLGGFHPVEAPSLDDTNQRQNQSNNSNGGPQPQMAPSWNNMASAGMHMNNNNNFGNQGSGTQNATFGSFQQMNNNSNTYGNSAQADVLDAAPLNLSLGGGGGSGGGGNMMKNMMQRKPSASKLLGNSAHRSSNMTSSKMKSNMSDGMLARALKAKYNQAPYGTGPRLAGSGNSSQRLRNSISSAAIRNRLSNSGLNRMGSRNGSALFGSSSQMSRLDEVEREAGGKGGGQNASWGNPGVGQRKPNSALMNALLGAKKNAIIEMSPNSSTSSNMLQQEDSGSRTSIQDFLAKSRDQARALSRQTSDRSLTTGGSKVDVSSLLPPEHAARNADGGNKSGNSSTNTDDSLLHQSCRLYATTPAVIESAIAMDPSAVRKTNPQQGYGYPINIAIKNKATLEVLKLLIQAGPDVLVEKDGNDGAGSLGIAVTLKSPVDVIRLILAGNSASAQVQDRRANYPVHTAVSSGLPLDIVTLIVRAYPEGLKKRNFHGLTPLEISQRSTRCPEEVMHFLQNATISGIEDGAQFIDNHKAPPKATPQQQQEIDFDAMMRTLGNL
jgi:hypothetical protein